jgi:hypothetical protein
MISSSEEAKLPEGDIIIVDINYLESLGLVIPRGLESLKLLELAKLAELAKLVKLVEIIEPTKPIESGILNELNKLSESKGTKDLKLERNNSLESNKV